jgi:hypothetical protein
MVHARVLTPNGSVHIKIRMRTDRMVVEHFFYEARERWPYHGDCSC